MFIAGDSILKNLQERKISRSAKVKVSSFPGCTIMDMRDHIKPVLRRNPNAIVMHVGTNSLRSSASVHNCAEEIVNLAAMISNESSADLVISGIILRSDDEVLIVKVFFLLDSKIDVLAINETKIDSSVNDNEIYLPGFEVVRKDRSVSGGGVCIYLQSNINYQILNDLCDDRLECVVIEIIRPHSRSFIVSTWYKPPNSPQDIFWQFGSLIDKVDSEQKDFYLLGDLNCNLHDGSNHNSSTLTNILDIYGLSQLISESTRITPTSSTLIDLCITSSPEKISKAGVVHWSPSLVFMTLKICYERTGSHRTIETCAFKNFNHHHFLGDVAQQPWHKIFQRQIRK